MIMNKKQQTDLTNGPIVQTLAKLALPIMACLLYTSDAADE